MICFGLINDVGVHLLFLFVHLFIYLFIYLLSVFQPEEVKRNERILLAELEKLNEACIVKVFNIENK